MEQAIRQLDKYQVHFMPGAGGRILSGLVGEIPQPRQEHQLCCQAQKHTIIEKTRKKWICRRRKKQEQALPGPLRGPRSKWCWTRKGLRRRSRIPGATSERRIW